MLYALESSAVRIIKGVKRVCKQSSIHYEVYKKEHKVTMKEKMNQFKMINTAMLQLQITLKEKSGKISRG